MGWFGVWLALLLPWLAGASLVHRFWPHPGPGRLALILGYGYWLGLPIAALLVLPLSPLGLRPAFWLILGLCLVIVLWAWRDLRWSKLDLSKRLGGLRAWILSNRALGLFNLQALLTLALLLWLGWRLILLGLHIWWQPLFPWDAWTTWALRARVWSELGQLVAFVPPESWAADQSGSLYTLEAWRYPPLVSLLALWPTLALGNWDETAANLPWLGAGMALALGFYGQARLWGAGPLTSLVAVWLLISLPLLETHIALAGYADLWLAGALGLSLIALLHWARTGDRRQLTLCLALGAIWPLLKLEGVVWLSLLALGLVAARSSWTRWQLALLGTGALLILILWLVGLRLTTPWGALEFSTQALELPLFGRFELGYHPNWRVLGLMLFGLENWHLLGYLLVLGLLGYALRVLLRRRSGGTQPTPKPWLRAALTLVLGSLLYLWALFFLTEAAAWAERGTASGRLLLQFMPLYVFFLLVLWLDQQQGPAARTS